jgi:ABC-2 type transport system permease protein
MLAIYKKEMRAYFVNPIGYIYMGVFLALSALVFCYTTFHANSYDLSPYFYYMIFAFAILIPLLTMRSFAEERKMRTEQLLMTAPISITGMVLGKFLAAFTMFFGSVLLSCINLIPLLSVAGEEKAAAQYAAQAANIGPVGSQIVGALIGVILIGAVFIAIGVFISALTESQLAAAVSTIGVVVFMVVLSFVNQIGSDAEGTRLVSSYAVRSVIDWISVLSRFNNFFVGKFDFAALFYYLSLAFVFVFLTVRVYEKRRWG